MTALAAPGPAATGPDGPWRRRRRRPVASFVALALAATALLGGLAWTRVANPTVSGAAARDTFDSAGRRRFAVAEITNRGSLPVRVTSLVWATSGLRDPTVLVRPAGLSTDGSAGRLGDLDRARPFEPFTLQGGEDRLVYVVGDQVCPNGRPTTWAANAIVIGVRSPVGIDRTRVLRATRVGPSSACP